MASHASCGDILRGCAEILRPPRRVPVADAVEQHMRIYLPGGSNENWNRERTPYMVEPMNRLADRSLEGVIFVGPSRSGKALDVSTPIPTPTGWKRMADLQEGDEVFGERGQPVRVILATPFQYGRTCYRVTLSDGESLVADAEHLWGVERLYWREPTIRYEVKSTESILADYLKKGKGKSKNSQCYRYRIRNTLPLQHKEKQLPIDPYLLGVWLGDGSKNEATISSHKDDAFHYVAAFEQSGHKVTVSNDGKNTVWIGVDRRGRLTTHCQRGHEFAVTGQRRGRNNGCPECVRLGHWRRKYGHDKRGEAIPAPSMFDGTFQSNLHRLGVLGNKRIPTEYLTASVQQRVSLLRGLLDTDGSMCGHSARVEFTTTLDALRDGFIELARSLGFKPVCKCKRTTWKYAGERKTGSAYRITFPVQPGLGVFSLPRKKLNFKESPIDVAYRQIVKIEPVESRPVKCIGVDSETNLYLAGRGMIPTHNTAALVDGWLVYAVMCDPGDMHIIHMTQATAQRYSQTRIDRLNQHSPAMQEKLSPYASDDNVFAKRYRNSMTLSIGWPSITQLSSFDLRYVALTDYDRFPEDVGREGDVFTPARKRTQTFMSAGKVLCESSPGKVLTDAKWQPANPHEGPPCGGIFALYNQGDRHRWFWPCPHCREFFTAAPDREAFTVVDGHACLICPTCGTAIEASHKPAMNAAGLWLAEGQTVAADRTLGGDAPKTNLGSYWLTGPAAAYQSWDSLVQRYDQAARTLERTGDEKPLQALVTTDFGTAYRPRNLSVLRDGRALANRAEDTPKRAVPAGVRFLTAAVDVQKDRFVVQVMGWGPQNERWLIDRYNLRWSRRLGGNGEPEPIDPARQLPDWAILLDQVACKPYPFADDPARGLVPVAVAVDSGGKAGVTERAYAFWRQARAAGLGGRIMLVKGGGNSGPRITRSFPDSSNRADRKANAMGEIPVWMLNTLILKDSLAADLERAEPGPGYIHLPNWLGTWFFDELTAETRTAKGWENLSNDRNEAFDLCVYNHAAALMLRHEHINWDKPPAWADPERSAVAIALIGDGEPAPRPPEAKPKAPAKRPPPRHDRSWSL